MSEWINCNDKLPDNPEKEYLIWVDGCYAIAYGIPSDDGSWSHSDIGSYERKEVSFTDDITHWMELPEFPPDIT